MKKLLIALLIALSLPLQTLAITSFKAATLYKGDARVAVYNKADADALFAKGFKLESSVLGFAPTTGYSERLTQSITNSATTIYVSSVLDRDGLALPLTSTNKGYFTLESGAAREEAIVCTGVNTSTIALTGCTRGLLATGSSESGTGLKYSHNAGSKIIMTNIAQFYGNYLDTTTDQTVAGIKTFSSSPVGPTPTTASQMAIKSYVDGVAIAGGANASTSTKGISYLSSDPASSTSPTALNSEEVSATSGNNKVVRANGSGKIDSGFIDQTANYTFSGTNTYSGTSTFSGNINGNGSVNTLATTTFSGLTKVPTSTPTVAGQVVGLDSSAKLPAVDGSQLTNLPTTGFVGAGTSSSTYYNFVEPWIYTVSNQTGTDVYWTTTNSQAFHYRHFQLPVAGDTSLTCIKTNGHYYNGNSALDFTKSFIVEWTATFSSNTVSRQGGMGVVSGTDPLVDYDIATEKALAFTTNGSGAGRTIYAKTSTGGGTTNHTETAITISDVSVPHTYRIEFNAGVNAKFYVDGVLLATVTTTLPTTGSALFGLGSAGNSGYISTITSPNFSVLK